MNGAMRGDVDAEGDTEVDIIIGVAVSDLVGICTGILGGVGVAWVVEVVLVVVAFADAVDLCNTGKAIPSILFFPRPLEDDPLDVFDVLRRTGGLGGRGRGGGCCCCCCCCCDSDSWS